MMERPQVNIRLDRQLLEEIDELASAERIDRSEMTRRLLDTGMSAYRLDMALGQYRRGNVSAWKAASLAGVSLYEMLDRIHEEGIPYELDPEILDRLDAKRGSLPAVRELAGRYGGEDANADAQSGIAAIRDQFRPDKVTTLFVGESSPAGGTHFYRANSNLFRATRAAFVAAFGEETVPDGARFLHYFRDQGCWLVDLADRPVNRLAPASRRQSVAGGAGRLAELIEQTQPARLVVVKASIGRTVREAAREAGYEREILELPFPVRQWRSLYVRQLAAALLSATGRGTSRGRKRRPAGR